MGRAARGNPFNQWKQEAAVSQGEAYDRMGRQIQQGDLVILPHVGDIMWRVTETKPLLDPRVQPGTLQMTLAAVMVEAFPGGVPLPGVIKIRDASEFRDQTPTPVEGATNEAPDPPAPTSIIVP